MTSAADYHVAEAERLLAELKNGHGSHGAYAPSAWTKAQAATAHIQLASYLREAERA
jgi:hypothetical protein